MTSVRAAVPVAQLAGGSALYRDFVERTDAPIHRRLGGFRWESASWGSARAGTTRVDGDLVERMVEANAAAGAAPETLERLRGLADGRTRAVVTGQQPGVAAGPLLCWYKAATAVALAEAIEARWATPCLAVFWIGSDDDDFAEIRELALVTDSLAVVSVSLDASVHAPGRRVGDIPAAAAVQAWDAVSGLLPAGDTIARVGEWMRGGADLGGIAARVLTGLTGGRMAVIDAREAALREAGRSTLLAFFDHEDQVRARVDEDSAALRLEGYHAQLEMGGDSGLFWVEEGTRRRIPTPARASARAAFARDIALASPGVVARNLVQDAVLAPVAVVLGPAEIAYRAQLGRVYDLLEVRRPAVFPRLSATFVPPPVAEAAATSGIEARLLASDAASWVEQVTRSLHSPRAAQAARAFEAAIRREAERFAAGASERLDARAKEKLERRIADLVNRAAAIAQGVVEQGALAGATQWPWLARAVELFARDGAPQERYVSALVPYTFHGAAAVDLVRDVAAEHVRDALDGRVLHRVYSR